MTKKSISKFLLAFLFVPVILGLCPALLLAVDGGPPPASGTLNISLENPLKSPDLNSLISDVISIVLFVGLPLIALYIMYVGFLYIKAQGKSTEITAANKHLQWVLIGAAVVLGSFTILEIIKQTVTAIKGS